MTFDPPPESSSVQQSRRIDTKTGQGISATDYDTFKADFEQLRRCLRGIDQAFTAWGQAARLLGDFSETAKQRAGNPLDEAWRSPAAARAQEQLMLAHATATALAKQCLRMANATDYAYAFATWYVENLPGEGMFSGYTTDATKAKLASYTNRLLTRYNEIIRTALPHEVGAQFLDSDTLIDGGLAHLGPKGGISGPDSTGGGLSGPGGSTGGGESTVPGLQDPADIAASGLGDDAGADLQGSRLAGAPNPGGGAGGGLGAGLAGADPYAGGTSLAGSGAGGVGGVPPGSGLGEGVGTGAAAPTGGAGSTAAGGAGGPTGSAPGSSGVVGAGAPGQGAQGEDEEARERTTWLSEDDDVWGDDLDIPPPVIEG